MIKPDDPMVFIATVTPSAWRRSIAEPWRRTVEEQLAMTPGCWHYSCAPQGVREYAPVIFDTETEEDLLREYEMPEVTIERLQWALLLLSSLLP